MVSPTLSRHVPIWAATFLLGAWSAALPPSLHAQVSADTFRAPRALWVQGDGRDHDLGMDAHGPGRRLLMLQLGPYAGLPLSENDLQPAFGAHVEWPATDKLSLAARYEWRTRESGAGYGCASLDAVRRLAGTDTVALAVTGGWARWQGRDRADVGMRFRGPMATASGGATVIEFRADVRYAFVSMRDVARLNGRLWAAVMLVVPLNITFGR